MKRTLSLLLLAACTISLMAKSSNQLNNEQLQLAIQAYYAEDYATAQSLLEQELQLHPTNGYAYAWYAVIENEDINAKVLLLRNALDYLPKSDKDYRAWTYSTLGRTHHYLGDTVQAIENLTQAIKLQPKVSEWVYNRGLLHLQYQQYEQALKDFEKAVKLDPNNIAACTWTGKLFHEIQDYKQAHFYYGYVDFVEPTATNSGLMAETEVALEMYPQAADHIIKALQLQPYESYAVALVDRNIPQLNTELIPRLTLEINKDPQSLQWKHCLAIIRKNKKQYEQAIDLIKAVQAITQSTYEDGILANYYQKLGDYEAALYHAKIAYETDTTYFDHAYLYASSLDELNRTEEAIQLISQYIDSNPSEYFAYTQRAGYYFHQGNYTQAIQDYTTALELDPTSYWARFMRGYAYKLTHQDELAEADFQFVIQHAEGTTEQVYAYILSGMPEQARILADKLSQDLTVDSPDWYNTLCCYSLMGDLDRAFSMLQELLESGCYNNFHHLRNDIDLIHIHGERFDQLVNTYETRTRNRVEAYRNHSNQH